MESQDTSLSSHAEKVALALAIVKSKPAELSSRDYILQLRRNIQEGRRQLVTQSLHRYIDGVAFWKDCCERAEAAQAELRLRILELERIDNSSISKPKRRKVAAYNPRKKQKKGAKSSAAATRKPSGSAEVSNSTGYDAGVESAELEGYGNAAEEALFMRHLYCFCQLLQDESPDLDKLSSILGWLSSATAKIISSVCDFSYRLNNFEDASAPSRAPRDDVPPSVKITTKLALGTLFRALSKVFTHLIHGFNTLIDGNRNTAFLGQVTYSLVKLFGGILDGIHKVSVGISHAGLEKAVRKHGGHQGHQEVPEPSRSETTDQETDLRAHLCRMLVAMFTHINVTKPGHGNLSDGFLYLLLQRAGQRLHFFVFNNELSQKNAKPNNEDHLQSGTIEAVEKGAMREEAKYLIWTLKRAMMIVQRQLNQSGNSEASNPPDKSSLAEAARTRLQYTLLQGVFGADMEEFRGALSMPAVAQGGLDVDIPTVSEEETVEWFKQELWALCGWEVLGRHIDFDF